MEDLGHPSCLGRLCAAYLHRSCDTEGGTLLSYVFRATHGEDSSTKPMGPLSWNVRLFQEESGQVVA